MKAVKSIYVVNQILLLFPIQINKNNIIFNSMIV